MSKAWWLEKDKARSCDGKNGYDTEWEAINMAAYRRVEGGRRHQNIHHYKCRHCNHYHIGHSKRPQLDVQTS